MLGCGRSLAAPIQFIDMRRVMAAHKNVIANCDVISRSIFSSTAADGAGTNYLYAWPKDRQPESHKVTHATTFPMFNRFPTMTRSRTTTSAFAHIK